MSPVDAEGDTIVAGATGPTEVGAPSDGGSGASLAPSAQLLGGRYEILGLVGAGGMGSVYRARDRELDEVVALKMLKPELGAMPGMLDRFRREVKLARKVTSARVARTFDIGEHEGARFLTMELVEGESLAATLARDGALPLARVVAVARGVCEGLAAAHAVGVVHRDLKPDNVLLGRDGAVKITDFGIAKVAASVRMTQGAVGTPAYMAPEQVLGTDDADARTDLYALGVMLYEMLTGALPFEAPTPFAAAALRLTTPPPDPRVARPETPPALAALVLGCMARDLGGRPEGAVTVGAALAEISLGAASEAVKAPKLAAPTSAAVVKTVAVLPLKNLGGADDAYVAEGLTDDLVDRLSMARALRLVSRAALEGVRGEDPRSMGQRLGVQVFVEGSVRRSGDRVRIAARLVSVADGFQIWADRFEGDARDALKLGDTAADAIARALTVERAGARPATIVDPAVLELYLRGIRAYHAFGGDSTREAVRLLRLAVDRAPDDATILGGYALALSRLTATMPDATEGGDDDPLAIAERAVQLAPSLGDAHLALSAQLFHTADLERAAAELRIALELAPSHAEANALLGRVLGESGRLEEAVRRSRAAYALDPRLHAARVEAARALCLLGDADGWEATLPELRLTRDDDWMALWGAWFTRVRLSAWLGRDLRPVVDQVRGTPVERDPRFLVVSRFVVDGKLDPAGLGFLTAFAGGRRHSFRRVAYGHQLATEVNLAGGLVDAALADLEQADQALLVDLAWLERCPLLAPLRGRETFARVRANVAGRVARVLAALGI